VHQGRPAYDSLSKGCRIEHVKGRGRRVTASSTGSTRVGERSRNAVAHPLAEQGALRGVGTLDEQYPVLELVDLDGDHRDERQTPVPEETDLARC
jgi:hypothetical protein